MAMSNQIDNLFKKKLEGHAIEPAPEAWSKISSRLFKKNKLVIWFRAAAAVVIIASAFWLYNYSSNIPLEIAEVTPQKLIKEKPLRAMEKTLKEKIVVRDYVNQDSVPKVQKSKILLAEKNNNKASHENFKNNNQKIQVITKPLESFSQVDNKSVQEISEVKEINTELSKPMVIVYELKSYAKEIRSESEFDPAIQRKSGLKKVLDVANNIRTGETPLSSLRQVKEDLFALNFKKEDKNTN